MPAIIYPLAEDFVGRTRLSSDRAPAAVLAVNVNVDRP